MSEQTEEWLQILSRALFWAAGLVLVLAVIGAIEIATTQDSIPGLESLTRQSRGIGAVAALGGGFTAAGILAGLGGILKALLAGLHTDS